MSGILAINSCDTKDLELTNPNELSPETFFKTPAQVQSSVNATYANLQVLGLYARHSFFALDLMGHDAEANSQLEGNKVPFTNFSFDGGSDIIQMYWEACFLGISKANFVLQNEEKIQALPNTELSQEQKNKFLAEAHFMRAYYYFLLVPRFGDLPIYTKQTIIGAARSPKEEVYKLITDDFDFASKNLLSKSVEQKGRATKEAAFAYLGKALLYQKKYDEALTAFNNVTGFTLENNFFNNFRDDTEHGPESIFEVEFDEKLGTGNKWDGNSGIEGTGYAETTLRGQEYGMAAKDWFNVYPNEDLVKAYEPGDKRYKATFIFPGDVYGGGFVMPAAERQGRKAGWYKYQNYYQREFEVNDSSINFKVMRYSDVLLMKAECENQRAGGVQSTAIGYINEVRFRANVPLLATNLSKDDVFNAIVHERQVEFAGEQLRFDDLIRWDKAGTELVKYGFQVGKSELWPIPNRETTSNPNIKPSDNNPGY
ncbi:RagB/SusD family nutrient uptake outer membrane protein [Flavobacterium sp.]|uniref:RagB/SusD family nutrient uptake outer membrane protein n=1 Tax=Flavobacterium sp. TaxID=239 RepID=UPI003264FAA6